MVQSDPFKSAEGFASQAKGVSTGRPEVDWWRWLAQLRGTAFDGSALVDTLKVAADFTGWDFMLLDRSASVVAACRPACLESEMPDDFQVTIDHGYNPAITTRFLRQYLNMVDLHPEGFPLEPTEGLDLTFDAWAFPFALKDGKGYQLHVVATGLSQEVAVEPCREVVSALQVQLELANCTGLQSYAASLVEDLLGHRYSPNEMHERLAMFGWQAKGPYAAVRIVLPEGEYVPRKARLICEKLREAWPYAQVSEYEGGISAVCPLSLKGGSQALLAHLEKAFSRRSCSVGISDPFEDLADFPAAHGDAAYAALENLRRCYGAVNGLAAGGACMLYDDCKVDLLRRALVREAACYNVLPCSLKRIRDYDDANGTCHLKTLVTYVRNACSKVDTCVELGIHRGTLDHRLRRVAELGDIDPSDILARSDVLVLFEAGVLHC